MTDKEILKMLEEIVQEVDYDIYKSLFVKACMESPEDAKAARERLVEIVKKYL